VPACRNARAGPPAPTRENPYTNVNNSAVDNEALLAVLSPATKPVIAAASEEHENYKDNKNGGHRYLLCSTISSLVLGLFYRGVATTIGFPPDVRRVLVPFPLPSSSPIPPAPGTVVVVTDPIVPVTTADPRGVVTLDPTRPGDVVDVCAKACPVISATAIAATK